MSAETDTDVNAESSTAQAEDITKGLQPDPGKAADQQSTEKTEAEPKELEDKTQDDKKTPKRDARINQLWKENKLKEEALKKERELRVKAEKELSDRKVAAIAKPKRTEFETDEAYDDAQDKYVKSLVAATVQSTMQEKESKTETDNAQQAEAVAWEKFDKTASELDPEQYPDFDDVMAKSATMEMSGVQREFFRTAPYGPQVFYHLGKNPELMDRVAKMPFYQQNKELERIEQQVIKATQTKKVSTAPPPISPIGGDRASVDKDPAKMTQQEFNEWRRKTTKYKRY